ncbi:hypothetical protein DEU40_11315 [Chryseobacterium sp. AG844]|nr:hypothetical protein DEU40_11315 [Chryseobacterium sp. AG844]
MYKKTKKNLGLNHYNKIVFRFTEEPAELIFAGSMYY